MLETSGLADPAPIVEAIRTDPVLVHHIVVSEIVVLVDAVNGLAHLRSEPLGRRQVETADRLVVTKVDAADVSDLKRLLATLRAVNPGAAITGAVKGSDVLLPTFAGVAPEPVAAADGESGAPIFPTRLHLDAAVDWTAFTVWLSALLHARGDDVLRVKGVVRTPAGRLLLQSVRKVVQSPEILPPQEDDATREDNTIVVIGRGYRGEDLRRSLEFFAGLARNLTKSRMERADWPTSPLRGGRDVAPRISGAGLVIPGEPGCAGRGKRTDLNDRRDLRSRRRVVTGSPLPRR